MNAKLKEEIAISIEKINYLFKNILSKDSNALKLELELLKRYSVELYDDIINYERFVESQIPASLPESGEDLVNRGFDDEEQNFIDELPTDEIAEDGITFENPLKEADTAAGAGILATGLAAGGLATNPLSDFEETKLGELDDDITNEIQLPDFDENDFSERQNFEEEIKEEVLEVKEEISPVEETTFMPPPEEETTTNEFDYTPTTEDFFKEGAPPAAEEPALEEASNFMDTHNPYNQMPAKEDIMDELTDPSSIGLEQAPVESVNSLMDDAKTDILPEMKDDTGDQTQFLNKNASFQEETPFDPSQGFPQEEEEPLDLGTHLANQKGSGKFDISFNDRFTYINELFDGDANTYEHTLNELGKCKDYISALAFLNLNVKMKYNWGNDNDTARDFCESIKRKFMG